MEQVENKVHQAFAVMDATTGEMMNYRQLIHSKKHSKIWNTSVANIFGQLANGIRGQIKGTTQSNSFEKQYPTQ